MATLHSEERPSYHPTTSVWKMPVATELALDRPLWGYW